MDPSLALYQSIVKASQNIYSIVRKTPLEHSLVLSKQFGVDVFLKCEQLQHTGSFKLRGATNKLQSLPTEVKHVVTASTGNHGGAVSFAFEHLKKDLNLETCTVFVPNNVDSTKAANIVSHGANLFKVSTNDCLDAENEAIKFVKEHQNNTVYISPYNDITVCAGQGTLGMEIIDEFNGLFPHENNLDAVFISVGGGGLIAGIATYIKHVKPSCKIIGCQPENSRVMYESVKSGKIRTDVIEETTWSEATAGALEEDTCTLPFVQQFVDEWVLLSESEIANAFNLLVEKEKIIVEGSAAMALAALIKTQDQYKNRRVCVLLCGRNISMDKIRKLLEP